jgi:hypothetical protein
VRWRSRTTASAAGICLVLAGCAGGDSEIDRDNLPKLVLLRSDVPPGFFQFDFGRLTITDVRPGPRVDVTRFGRVDGWKARYRRAGGQATRGPLIIESRVDAFDDADGARQDLDAYKREFDALLRSSGIEGRALPPPDVGEEAVAVTARQGAGTNQLRLFLIAWRERNATASITTTGFEGRTTLRDAMRLVHKQQRHLAPAG